MNYRYILFFLVFLAIFGVQVSALEETKVIYKVGSVGDEWKYWNGQGEYKAGNTPDSYILNLNGNKVLSYATRADHVKVTSEALDINGTSPDSAVEFLFYTTMPKGRGVYTTNISLPYVSTDSVQRNLHIELENVSQVLYLNGPVIFEDDRFSSMGTWKIIDTTTKDTEISIAFLTTGMFHVISVLVTTLLFALVVLVVIFFRRKDFVSVVTGNLQSCLGDSYKREEKGFRIIIPSVIALGCIVVILTYSLWKICVYVSSVYLFIDSFVLFLTLLIIIAGYFIFSKRFSFRFHQYLKRLLIWEDDALQVKIPDIIFAVVTSLVFIVLILWAIQILLSHYHSMLFGIGGASFIVACLILIFIGGLIGILVLSSRSEEDYCITFSVIIGGILLMSLFNFIGFLAISVAVLAGGFMNLLIRVIFINNK
jgi:hypothetical protein